MAEEQISPQSKSKIYQNQLLLEHVKGIFLDADTADVHFTFDSVDGGVVRVPAHKILLAVNSNVFKRMFYGELKENGDVKMVDVSDAAFKEFLQYFYLSEVKLTEENIQGVIYLGHKYNVKKCIEDCIQFLADTLSNGNVFIALHIGILYDHQKLIKSCDEVIVVNTDTVFKSIGFFECDKVVLAHILKMNVVSCSEVDVFQACMAWVKSKSCRDSLTKVTVRKHLGDLYYDIRFASMTMEQLCDLSSEYKSVLSNDFETITNIIVKPGFKTDKFKTCSRHAKWNAVDIVKCDCTLGNEENWYKLPVEYKTTFSTNNPLLLGSFMCVKVLFFGSSQHDLRSNLSVDVEIAEASNLRDTDPKCILKMRTHLQSTDTEVLLPHPILIRPGFFYKISIGKFPYDHYFYSKEIANAWQGSDIEIAFHNSNYAKGSGKKIGIVSVLNFNKI